MGHLIFWDDVPLRPLRTMPQLCRDPDEPSGNEKEAAEGEQPGSPLNGGQESPSARETEG